MNYYKFEDLDIGMSFEFKEVVTEEKMALFLKLSGDNNTLHCDEEYAKRSNMEGRVVYGMLSSSFYSTLVGVYLPGENCLLQEIKISFNNPLYIGEELVISGTIVEKDDTFKRTEIKASIKTIDGKVVSKAKIKVGVRE